MTVATHRSDGVFDALPARERERLRRGSLSRWRTPMLATLTHDPFSDPGWIFERKLDGMRCLVERRGRRVRLLSRAGETMNATWPELVEALGRDPCRDFIADGEIVAFEGARTSFQRLQHRLGLHDAETARAAGVAVYLYLFDLLYVAGHDATRLSQRARKTLLKRALSFGGHVRYTPHRNACGLQYLQAACRRGWEGLIAKDAAAAYVHGRSRAWRKFKCVRRQELVVGGFTDPHGARREFGALLVGYYDDHGALRYAGKVGTGYDAARLATLGGRLRRLERHGSPFADMVRDAGAHFVRPRLVAEIAFTEWTRAGRLRHPRFVGLRTDKPARAVRRERAEA